MFREAIYFRGLGSFASSMMGGVVLVGNFDGWHCGHHHLCSEALSLNLSPIVVLTFEPHPREFFSADCEPFRLTSLEQKVSAMIGVGGMDAIVSLDFDESLSAMSSVDFMTEILLGGLGCRGVVVGSDFRFGRGRLGGVSDLEGMFETLVVDAKVGSDGEVISSSRIRELLVSGEVELANRLLGRPYAICGIVEEGDKLGATLGFATANIPLGIHLRPGRGVYVSRIKIEGDDRIYGGVSNYGFRPTVDGLGERFETHIFDFGDVLYGRGIEVFLLSKLRDEVKFSGLAELTEQIGRDCDLAREYLNLNLNL